MKLTLQKLISNAKKNLFRNPSDGFITLVLLLVILYSTINTFDWFFNIANWDVITKNLNLYITGSFPQPEKWRANIWIGLLSGLCFFTFFSSKNKKLKILLPVLWILIIPLGIYLLSGGLGLTEVKTNYWGGLLLTLILTCCSAAIAFLLGLILAIGRQSNLQLIRTLCRVYIDLMRALPLIAVLFFGQLLIPLFLPVGFEINRFTRAVLAFGFFAAAYVAEDIRGGMQAIPSTQYEAAKVLGLNSKQTLELIILPQAIRTAIPALTNQAIGLLQNTSLMAILGLVELLGVSRSILANPKFIGNYLEVYVWLAIIYWFICTIVALIARHIETQMNPTNPVR